MKDDFLPVPDSNYEINSELICRNRKTKHVLRNINDRVWLLLNGKKDLFNRAFLRRLAVNSDVDNAPLPVSYTGTPIPVILFHGDEQFHFKSIAAAARFLTDKIFYTFVTCCNYIKTDSLPDGWHATLIKPSD